MSERCHGTLRLQGEHSEHTFPYITLRIRRGVERSLFVTSESSSRSLREVGQLLQQQPSL